MESIKDKMENSLPQKNFFNHVFNFDKESQHDILNCLQYVILAIIPTVILNKCVQKIIPETNEDNNNIVILAEIVGQLLFMILGFIVINRIITYFPTWSTTDYKETNFINIIIVFLSILLTIQSKVGTKTNILLDRLFDYIEGSRNSKPQQQQTQQTQQPQQPQQASLLPPPMVQTNSPVMNIPNQGPEPDFNKMYEGPNTPLVNAMVPGQGHAQESFAPMAANEGFGGAFGASF